MIAACPTVLSSIGFLPCHGSRIFGVALRQMRAVARGVAPRKNAKAPEGHSGAFKQFRLGTAGLAVSYSKPS
jgi:hypothetical protein